MRLKSADGIVVCNNLKRADSFIDRMFGLLLKSNPPNMLFKTRFGIHTFFLKQPIDLLILNSQHKIVKIKKALRPNSLLFWNPIYSLVLELEAGTIDRYSLKKNSLVVIK